MRLFAWMAAPALIPGRCAIANDPMDEKSRAHGGDGAMRGRERRRARSTGALHTPCPAQASPQRTQYGYLLKFGLRSRCFDARILAAPVDEITNHSTVTKSVSVCDC